MMQRDWTGRATLASAVDGSAAAARVRRLSEGPTMPKTPELANLYWSAAGLYPGEGEISPYDFETRVKSTARAGFTGIGLWHTDLEHILVNRTLRDVRAILDDNGVGAFEVEFIADWFVDGQRRRESDARKKRLFEASAALSAHHIKVGDFYNTPVTMSRLIDEFGALCLEARTIGATIGFEFMGSAMIHTLEESRAMVEGAGQDNGGLIVDIAHVTALDIPFAEVAQIPRRHLVAVELNDNVAKSAPGYSPGRRKFCGEGAFDIQGFVAACRAAGYDGPWAVEVFSPELTAVPIDELNTRAFDSTMAALVAPAARQPTLLGASGPGRPLQ